MKLINEYEESGYIIKEYDNGYRETFLKPSENIEEVKEEMTQYEEAILNTALNVEYLVCLSELNI